MAKKSPYSHKLKNTVVLTGQDKKGKCVYSALLSVHQYYDGSHPWDEAKQVKALSLRIVHGFIFGAKGEVEQEFESQFNLKTGIFEKGWSRDETGKISKI
jgi:hypothetical protein